MHCIALHQCGLLSGDKLQQCIFLTALFHPASNFLTLLMSAILPQYFSHNSMNYTFQHCSCKISTEYQIWIPDDDTFVCDISPTFQRLVIPLFAGRGTANRRKEATKMARSLSWKKWWKKARVKEVVKNGAKSLALFLPPTVSSSKSVLTPIITQQQLLLLRALSQILQIPISTQKSEDDYSWKKARLKELSTCEGGKRRDNWIYMGSNRRNTVARDKKRRNNQRAGWWRDKTKMV